MSATPKTYASNTIQARASRLLNDLCYPLFRRFPGFSFAGMRMAEIVTAGRKSGLPRPILMPTASEYNGGYTFVGSFGGSRRQPDWYYNVKANPHVEVTIDGVSRPMMARIAEGGEERLVWRTMIGLNPLHLAYYLSHFVAEPVLGRRLPLLIVEPLSD